jgi:hypothetical protein
LTVTPPPIKPTVSIASSINKIKYAKRNRK